jgi:hypothetical protein
MGFFASAKHDKVLKTAVNQKLSTINYQLSTSTPAIAATFNSPLT